MNIFQALMTAGHDEDFEPSTYGPRTLAAPGSFEKVEVMRRRIDLGQHLFHPGDEWVLASHESARVMGHTVIQIAKMKRGIVNETIKWIPVADSVPDDDTTVLLFTPNAGEPVWLGYRDDDDWSYVDGLRVEHKVTHWAYTPEGPK